MLVIEIKIIINHHQSSSIIISITHFEIFRLGLKHQLGYL